MIQYNTMKKDSYSFGVTYNVVYSSNSNSKIILKALNLCKADSKALTTISFIQNRDSGNSKVCSTENHQDMKIAKEDRPLENDMPRVCS